MTIRPYTPTSPQEARGYVDLVVKCYPTGKMSQVFDRLKVGDEIEMKARDAGCSAACRPSFAEAVTPRHHALFGVEVLVQNCL